MRQRESANDVRGDAESDNDGAAAADADEAPVLTSVRDLTSIGDDAHPKVEAVVPHAARHVDSAVDGESMDTSHAADAQLAQPLALALHTLNDASSAMQVEAPSQTEQAAADMTYDTPLELRLRQRLTELREGCAEFDGNGGALMSEILDETPRKLQDEMRRKVAALVVCDTVGCKSLDTITKRQGCGVSGIALTMRLCLQ
jgi:hypothetical protein